MSAGGGILRKIIDPAGLFSGGGGKKDKPADAAPANAAIEARGTDFAVRERSAEQRADFAGASRSDNEADLLGYVLPKKRSAGREILG